MYYLLEAEFVFEANSDQEAFEKLAAFWQHKLAQTPEQRKAPDPYIDQFMVIGGQGITILPEQEEMKLREHIALLQGKAVVVNEESQDEIDIVGQGKIYQ